MRLVYYSDKTKRELSEDVKNKTNKNIKMKYKIRQTAQDTKPQTT